MSVIFWGNLEPLMQGNAAGGLLHHSNDRTAVLQFVERAPPKSLLCVRDDLIMNNPEVVFAAAAKANLKIALVYDNLRGKAKFENLQKFESIDHILPLHCKNTQTVINRSLTHSFDPKVFEPNQLLNEQNKNIISTTEFDKTYEEVSKYVLSLNYFLGFESTILIATSELLTNAFYNGNRNAHGTPLVFDRKISFGIEDKKAVSLRYGCDDQYLWLIVRDQFGTLSRNNLIQSLVRAATQRTPKLDSPGGAGLGLLMLFEWTTELSFIIVPNQSTTVVCKFKLTKRNRLFESEPSALHVFFQPKEAEFNVEKGVKNG